MSLVLFDSRSANSSRITGWERFTRELAIRIIGKHDEFEIIGNKSSTQTTTRRIFSDLTLIKKSNHKKISLVHFPTFPPLFSSNKKRLSLFHIHDLTWWKYPEFSSVLGNGYYKFYSEKYIQADGFISTGSETVKNELMDFFHIDPLRVHVVYPGTNICNCEPFINTNEKPYVLSVGTIEPRKNIQVLIDAYLSSKIRHDIDLKIVGRKGWIKELPQGVAIMESVSDAELHVLYANAKAVFQPSMYEGFGLPLIEAANHGKRVICSDIPVFREVLGDLGVYIQAKDKDAWIDALNELPSLAELTFELKETSRKFSWQSTAASTLRLYHMLLNQK